MEDVYMQQLSGFELTSTDGMQACDGLAACGKKVGDDYDDDHEGHYVFNLGENITPRYKILSKMGEGVVGTFGRDLECWYRQTREYVAIKMLEKAGKEFHYVLNFLEIWYIKRQLILS